MIEYIGRDGSPEAMNVPALICDACREQVVDSGNIYWAVRWRDNKRESSPLFASHKHPCYRVVETLLADLYPLADGWSGPLSNEAGEFLRHLANNFRQPFTDDADGTYHQHDLVQPQSFGAPADLMDSLRRHRRGR